MINENLKKARKAKGMTQARVAGHLGVAVITIRQYESGSREPSLYTLVRLADLYDVTTDYLLNRVDFHLAGQQESQCI